MLRLKVLAVLWLGVLVSCGPTETGGAGSAVPLKRTSAPLTYENIPTLMWTGSRGVSTCALSCPPSPNFECKSSPHNATRTFEAEFIAPALSDGEVVGLEAKVYGRFTDGGPTSANLKLLLNGQAIGPLSVARNVCTGSGTCDADKKVSFGPNYITGVPGYQSGTNRLQLEIPAAGGSSGNSITYCLSHIDLTLTVAKKSMVVSPVSLNFGDQQRGTTSNPRAVTVTNTGETPLSIQVTKAGSSTFVVSPTSFNLAKDQARTLDVTFSPILGVTTDASGYLTITSDPATQSETVNLSGTGVSSATQLTTTKLTFAAQPVGTSRTLPVTVSNVGGASIQITGAQISPASAGSIFKVTPTTPLDIPKGESRDLLVTFTPMGTGLTSPASLQFKSSEDTSILHSVTLEGTGTTPSFVLTKTRLDFGEQGIKVGPKSMSSTLSNTGTGALKITNVSIKGTGAGRYSVTPNAAFDVANGSPRDIAVEFDPDARGAVDATLSLTLDTGGSATASPTTIDIPLSGTGVEPILSLSPVRLDFGSRKIGASEPHKLMTTVTNTGTGTLSVGSASITGTGASAYTVDLKDGFDLVGTGTKRDLWVTFTPGAKGLLEAILTLPTNEGSSTPRAVPLSGIGVAYLDVAPTGTLAFGNQVVAESRSQTVVLSNASPNPITLKGFSVAPPFSVSGLSSTQVIPVGGSFTFNVSFTPTSVGAVSGKLTLLSDAFNDQQELTLTGTGIAPMVEFTPSTVTMEAALGARSALTPVVLKNTGKVPLTVTGFSIAASTPSTDSHFRVVEGLSGMFTLQPDETRTFQVDFGRSTLGTSTANLTLGSNAFNQAAALTLIGNSHGGKLSVSPSPISFSPQAVGSSASKTVTLTNNGDRAITLTNVTSSSPVFTVTGSYVDPIAPGRSISLQVTYTPTECALAPGKLVLSSDVFYEGPTEVTMSGTGECALLEYSFPDERDPNTRPLGFGKILVGSSVQKKVRLTNSGSAVLNLSEISWRSSSSSMTYSGLLPQPIPSKGSVDFSVTFNPTAIGDVSAELTLTSNSFGAPKTVVSFTGSGVQPILSLDQTSIYFGEVRVGASETVKVKLTNLGGATLHISGLSVNGPFTVTGLAAGMAVDATKFIEFDVIFKPIREGPPCRTITSDAGTVVEECNISIISDAKLGSTVLELGGTGTISVVDLSLLSVDFGMQRVAEFSEVQPVILTNTGKATLEIEQFIFSNSAFSLESPSIPSGKKLEIIAGDAKPLSVRCNPSTIGPQTGKLYIVSNAFKTPEPISVMCEGVDGQISLSPSVSFGGVDVGSTGALKTVELTNSGKYPLKITKVIPPVGPSGEPSPFHVSGLTLPLTLKPADKWPMNITFNPPRRDFFSGTFGIESDAKINPNFNLELSGIGFAPAVELDAEVNFGKSNVGETVPQMLTIKNVGETTLSISGISFESEPSDTSDAARDFKHALSFPLTVNSKESMSIPLKFSPQRVGLRRALAVVSSNAKTTDGKSLRVTLMGTGTSPTLELSESAMSFQSVVDSSSKPKTLTLKNKGTGPITLTAMKLSGADVAYFFMEPKTLPITLQPGPSTPDAPQPPGSTVDIVLTFRPNMERTYSALLSVESSNVEWPSVSVPLSGRGTRTILMTGAPVEFGQHLINGTSRPREVLILNGSESAVTISSITVEDEGTSQFSVSRPRLPYILEQGKELKLALTFTPLSEVEAFGKLKVAFSDTPLLLEGQLRGRGIPAVLTVKPGSWDFGTIRAGNTSKQTFLLTNLSNDPIVLSNPTMRPTGEPFTFKVSGTDGVGAGLDGLEIRPNNFAAVDVTYAPIAETLSETILSFDTATPKQPRPVDIPLKGRGTKLLLSVDTEPLDFGRVEVGTSEEKVVTVTNVSAQPQLIEWKSLKNPSPFALDPKDRPEPVPPQGTVSFKVRFTPESSEPVEDDVQVSLRGAAAPEAQLKVSGRGRSVTVDGGGCSSVSAEAGTAGLLALLALVGLGSRRRRRE